MSKHSILEGVYKERNGVFYFTDVPSNVVPSRSEDPTDRKKWSTWRKENYSFFKDTLAPVPDRAIVVDIGAGEAQFHDLMDRFEMYAVDFYPYRAVNVVCDINGILPFKTASADALVLSNVLEHVAEPNALLAECHRILKKGGVILIAVPFLINVHQRPYDYYRYTDVNLDYLLKKAGFKTITVTPVVSLHGLFFNMTSRLFTDLIQNTQFSRSHFIQSIHVVSLKFVWLFTRVVYFTILGSVFKKCAPNNDYPLGYHCRAVT